MRDEAIKAYVVLANETNVAEDELIEWCSSRLAAFKVPANIEFVDGLPRTSGGTIQKEELRQGRASGWAEGRSFRDATSFKRTARVYGRRCRLRSCPPRSS